jgi:hypothetical protein
VSDVIAAFCAEVARGGSVFSFTVEETFPVYPVDGGRARAVPFWSTRRRADDVRASHDQYERYAVAEIPAAEFLEWLTQLGDEGFRIGLNWDASGMMGPDVQAGELRFALEATLRSAASSKPAGGKPAAREPARPDRARRAEPAGKPRPKRAAERRSRPGRRKPRGGRRD